ncbi:MAG: cysteine--tRNA ligase [Candidatus Caldarchaeum sp.]|nr:cysteine--tRNA ligase [Candidatus Caldarchaeum sp.]MDW8359424.1 cysteine--tRNA ligase [Candidatus Caldarchaeum sp.]
MTKIRVFNTLSRSLEVFETWSPGVATVYVCGPTVYDVAHLGHARTYVAFDAVIRFLEFMGYGVKYSRNITDVGHLRETGEDKMIQGAVRLRRHPMEVADKYMMEFFSDMNSLGIRRPDIQPRASMHIPDIIDAVEKLLDKGYAYRVDGSVYFDVSKVPDYGKLSKIRVEEMDVHRVEPDPRKRNPADFALWKESAPDYPLCWRTPWGYGFPGWHIECSVMSMKYLGEQIDIHGGGQDLIFPHHENEIAQSEALTGRKPFVRYWLHTGELTVGGKGMHKSLGNYLTIKEVLKNYSRSVVRAFILSAHYRTPLDYSEKAMEQAHENVSKVRNLLDDLALAEETAVRGNSNPEFRANVDKLMDEFINSMSNDFNTSNALASLYELVRLTNLHINRPDVGLEDLQQASTALRNMCRVLGLMEEEREKTQTQVYELLKILLDVRRELRRRGLYDLGDRIRKELGERGILVEDLKDREKVRIVR